MGRPGPRHALHHGRTRTSRGFPYDPVIQEDIDGGTAGSGGWDLDRGEEAPRHQPARPDAVKVGVVHDPAG
jgi:hypothetical protein